MRERFIAELQLQCCFAHLASLHLTNLFANPPTTVEENRFYPESIWYELHGLLVAAGNISKIFWPDRGGDPQRGETLRRDFNILEDSPLSSRALRNHFEHVDERIENSKASGNIDLNIGPELLPAEQVFRHFIPQPAQVIFDGRRYDLKPLMQAIRELQTRLGEPF